MATDDQLRFGCFADSRTGVKRLAADARPVDIYVGDPVGFGVSHPCTTMDKWRLIPVLDDSHWVVECVRTYF